MIGPILPHLVTFIPPSEWAVCLHEAGHACVALIVGVVPAFMEIIDVPKPHGRNRLPVTSGSPRRLIAVGGYAVELALFRAGRLVDEAGAAIGEKAFIDQAIGSNASLDKAAFFERDGDESGGGWSRAADSEFMTLGEQIHGSLDMKVVSALATALMSERSIDTERICEIAKRAADI